MAISAIPEFGDFGPRGYSRGIPATSPTSDLVAPGRHHFIVAEAEAAKLREQEAIIEQGLDHFNLAINSIVASI
ncbi:hypothetical protein JKY72_01135 [Candidatus Gracilibacteria bacterium]|nr:hypothetical protein [Candidatus Gracilibacteria bacterium]